MEGIRQIEHLQREHSKAQNVYIKASLCYLSNGQRMIKLQILYNILWIIIEINLMW